MSRWLDDPVVEDDLTVELHMSDGTVYVDADVSVTEADYRRMAQGYVCPWCYQVLEHAFDRTCRDWCLGGPDATREDWLRYMDERFGGEKWIGPSRATIAAAEQALDRADRPRSRLWLPPRTG